MGRFRLRIAIVALAVVCFAMLLPDMASAGSCTVRAAGMPAERVLAVEQTLFLDEAVRPGHRIVTPTAGLVAVPAYCTCPGSTCGTGPEGMKLVCVLGGCVSWDGSDGIRRVGICAPAPAPDDPVN